jgi:UDP-N-acetylglucosamine 4-epimerase
VENAVQVNLLAALTGNPQAIHEVYNVALNRRTTLKELFDLLRRRLAVNHPQVAAIKPVHRDFREGDVLHSLADISKAEKLLGYQPTHDLDQGLAEAVPWYEKHSAVHRNDRPGSSTAPEWA